MIAYVVDRNLTEDEIKQLIENPGPIYNPNNRTLPTSLSQLEEDCEGLPGYVKSEIYSRSVKRTISVPSSLNEKIHNPGFSTLINPWHYHKYRVCFEEIERAYFTRVIQACESKYDQTIIFSAIADISCSSEVRVAQKKPTRPKGKSLQMLGYFSRLVFNGMLSRVQGYGLKSREHVLVTTSSALGDYIEKGSLKTITSDRYVGYLADIYNETDKAVIMEDTPPPRLFGTVQQKKISNFTKNFSSKSTSWIYARALFNPKILLTLYRESNKLKNYYSSFQSHKKNDDLLRRIAIKLKARHLSTLYYTFRMLAWFSFLKSRKSIKSITCKDENSPLMKSILDAAKTAQKKTFGIQHGGINGIHPGYLFDPIEVQQMPMPDFTITWGDKWKRILVTDCNYPENSVQVCGQIRTDIIPRLKEIDKERVVPGSTNKYMITFATQPMRDQTYRKRAMVDMATAMIKLGEDYMLVIKPHPNEGLADIKMYENLAREQGLRNLHFAQGVELYTLLAASDVVSTCFSTIGSEVVCFRKPLLILDHLEQDYFGYIAQGVGIKATNSAEIQESLSNLKTGKKSINQTAYDDFISEHNYKIDGLASQRTWNFIVDQSR